MKLLITIIIVLLSVYINAQELTETDPKNTVLTYFEGYESGDTTLLKTVFHPTFHLSWINPWGEGERAYMQVDRQGMFNFFGPNWNKNEITCQILDENSIGDMSLVTARVEIVGVVIWTDYISLLQIDDWWWIVSKVSVGVIVD